MRRIGSVTGIASLIAVVLMSFIVGSPLIAAQEASPPVVEPVPTSVGIPAIESTAAPVANPTESPGQTPVSDPGSTTVPELTPTPADAFRPAAVISAITGVDIVESVLDPPNTQFRINVNFALPNDAIGGDTFTLNLDPSAPRRLTIPDQVFPVTDSGGNVIAQVSIVGGVATFTLDPFVETVDNITGNAFVFARFRNANSLAGTTQTLQFQTGDGVTFSDSVAIATLPQPTAGPSPTPRPPTTRSAKSGSFARPDQGRTNPSGAINWVLTGNVGAATEVIFQDTLAPDAGWTIDCATVAITPADLVATANIECTPTSLTVVVSGVQDGASNRPRVRFAGNIVAAQVPGMNLSFRNAATITTDGLPETRSFTVNQTGGGGGGGGGNTPTPAPTPANTPIVIPTVPAQTPVPPTTELVTPSPTVNVPQPPGSTVSPPNVPGLVVDAPATPGSTVSPPDPPGSTDTAPTTIPQPTDPTLPANPVEITIDTPDGDDIPFGTSFEIVDLSDPEHPVVTGDVPPDGALPAVRLPDGTYILRIDAPGYEPFSVTFSVVDGRTSIIVTLRPLSRDSGVAPAATVSVTTLPLTGSGTGPRTVNALFLMSALLAILLFVAAVFGRRRPR